MSWLAKYLYVEPPLGWEPFGAFIDGAVNGSGIAYIECSQTEGRDGLPLWERAVGVGADPWHLAQSA